MKNRILAMLAALGMLTYATGSVASSGFTMGVSGMAGFIETEGQEFGEEPETVSKRYSLKAPGVDDSTATTVIGVVLALILLFVLWYFTRSGSRRPGAPFW